MAGKKNTLGHILCVILLVVNLVVCCGLIASAYCGYVPPTRFRFAPLIVMTFPAWVAGAVALLVLDALFCVRQIVLPVLSILVCWPMVHDFCPLNLPKGSMTEQQKERAFTLMTYNVMQFFNQDEDAPRERNEQLEYIFRYQPDVVCIQEACYFVPNQRSSITQEQLAELSEIYKYVYIKSETLALLSKYEAEPIPIDYPKGDFESGDIAAWRLHINGEVVNIFNVHLRSYRFSPDQKHTFREITTPDNVNRSEISTARHEILPKVFDTTVDHAAQTRLLLKYIKKFGGENVIVCGDFNEPVGCYPLHLLERDADLRQVYTEVGFGPKITYSANHFFFRIDHVLYRGNLRPYSITRGGIKASDHYPLTTTFILD